MFFYTAQFIWILIRPLTFLAILLAVFALGYAITYRRIFARLLYLTIALFVLFGFMPIGHNMLVALERQYERPQLTDNTEIDGIIVLGGSLRLRLSRHYGYPVLGGSGSRLSEFIHLLKRYPQAQGVFTGGSGDPFNQDISAADYARQLIQRISPSIDTQRIIFEGESRNTYQNAVKSYQRVGASQDATWLLITSASHMPRAMAVFQSQGWPKRMIAYPVDHRTNGQYKLLPNLNVAGNFNTLENALHEYIGYVIYVLTDRIKVE